jgi:Ca2+/Na+ antiporter
LLLCYAACCSSIIIAVQITVWQFCSLVVQLVAAGVFAFLQFARRSAREKEREAEEEVPNSNIPIIPANKVLQWY